MIERSHHHILWSRIPHYARGDLLHVQSVGKSVFEYWAHALAYIPACDYRFFMPAMKRHRENPTRWFAAAAPAEMRRILARIRDEGPLTIRDIDDDDLVERDHPWASRGQLTISARSGMVKTYELTDRHFGWPPRPRAASERQILEYLLHRALRAQGVVSLDSACYMDVPRKKAMAALIEARVVRRRSSCR